MKFQLTQISLLVSSLFLAAGAQAQSTTDVGTINVQGAPGGTNTGLIQQEDTPKARSSVNRDYIDKQGATANPFQLLNQLPGVNAYGNDATGLFGGNIRLRGFNSDQIGLTINGAPVNDSGNFAVFPQEYTDQENLCSIFVTQGSTDSDAPHVGASGGNIGIVSCQPKDTLGGLFTQTFGSDSLRRTFLRVDSGKLFNDMVKFYVSQSHAEADKFRGLGGANRDHTDFGARLDLGAGSYVDTSFLYNRAINNNYRALSKQDIQAQGYYADYGTIAPVHQTPVAGTRQDDTTFAPNVANAISTNAPGTNSANSYYGFALNPFKNYVATVNAHWQVAPKLSIDVNPYMWYGYGTGGVELQNTSEATFSATGAAVNPNNVLHRGVADANGDGDTLDRLYFYNGSVTKTYRPGVTAKVNLDVIPYNHIQVGYWYEKTRHQQTAPYIQIDSQGNVPDLWEADPKYWVKQQDGQPAEFRDWYTRNTVRSPFITDNISLFDDKLVIALGMKHDSYQRDFVNSANQGTGAAADYAISRTYAANLPSVGVSYHLTPEQSVFINGAKNFRAPNNTALSGLVTGGTFVNGVLTGYTLRDPDVTAEHSYNYDAGYRYAGERVTFSGSVFYVNYNNRIATAFDPNRNVSTDYNVGHSTSKGAEMEAGFKVTNQISLYGSASYIRSKLDQDFRFAQNIFLPTTGKTFPGTPKYLGALNVQYQSGPIYAFAQAKYTGRTYTTLVNDDSVASYTLVNLGADYQFPQMGVFKEPIVRANIFNLFSRKYLNLNTGSGNSYRNNALPIVTAGGVKAAEIPTFYVGSPITFSVSIGTSF
jgi:iron complex outermembrane receptor protein